MHPLRLIEITPDHFRLELIAGTTDVDPTITKLGHESNGPFWEGIAELLIQTQAPDLDGRVFLDSEADAFCANSQDRDALERLATLLRGVATDADRVRQLVELASTTGFKFHD